MFVGQSDQPAARISPVHQQQVAGAEQVEVFEQYLSFVLVDAVQ